MEREKEKEEKNNKEDKEFKSLKLDTPNKFKFEKEYLSNYFKPHTSKRGRFTIEDYSALESKFEVSREYKKGRFHVIETKPLKVPHKEDLLKMIVELQNEQLKLLYSFLNNENEQFKTQMEEVEELLRRL